MNQFHLYKSFAWLFRFVLQRRTFNFHLFQEMRIATRRQAQPTWHMVFKKRNFRMGMSFASWESDVASARELRAPTPSPSAMRVSVGRKGILRICTWGLRCTNERGGGLSAAVLAAYELTIQRARNQIDQVPNPNAVINSVCLCFLSYTSIATHSSCIKSSKMALSSLRQMRSTSSWSDSQELENFRSCTTRLSR